MFALTFGLLISDYMSRQVLNAVFPLLKAEWGLSDARLGLLSGIVALMVGVLTFPLSLSADRWGRVRSLTLMAVLWSVATLACGLARNFEQMFLARLFVGVGEAAYGSVGIAVVLSVFPARLRATVTGAFMAGGMFGFRARDGGRRHPRGAVRLALGVCRHGALRSGARCAVSDRSSVSLGSRRQEPAATGAARNDAVQTPNANFRSPLATVFATPSVISAYVGSGLQLFIGASLVAWMPSYLNRYYGMGADEAGVMSAAFVLCSGAGMIVCGSMSDRFGRNSPPRKLSFAIALCLRLLRAALDRVPASPPVRSSSPDRRGHVRRCGDRRAGRRDGGQSHPRRDSRHGVRDADAREQPAGPRARTVRDRRTGGSSGPANGAAARPVRQPCRGARLSDR